MQVILLLTAVAILGGVVLAALGRAGEMAAFRGDYAPPDLDEMTAADVALLRPPTALWGYNVPATEEALQLIARSMTAREVEIATLRRELADLRDRQVSQLGKAPAPAPDPPGGGQPSAWPERRGGGLTAWPGRPDGDLPAWPEHPAGDLPPWPERPGGEVPPWPTLPRAGPDD